MAKGVNALGWPAPAWRGLLVLVMIIASLTLIGSISLFARYTGALVDFAQPGMTMTPEPDIPAGWLRVHMVEAGGASATAGIKPGDQIRFRKPLGFVTCCRQGERTPILVRRGEALFQTDLVARNPLFVPAVAVLSAVGGLIISGLGLLLLLRGRQRAAATMLAIVLVSMGQFTARGALWAPTYSVALLWIGWPVLAIALVGYFWPKFALEISGGARTAAQARQVERVALLASLVSIVAQVAALIPVSFPVFGSSGLFWVVYILLHQGYGYWIIASNYRYNNPGSRNRLKIVVAAFVCFMVSQQFVVLLDPAFISASQSGQQFALRAAFTLFAYSALGLLVYAVLGQRLFDLNFALNRTLVYGALSFILLAGFGLAEWAVERLHLIPEAWHEGGTLVSAAIALALFLSFHRLRDWVERHVERVLFSSWHRNEQTLRRFVTAAGHYDKAPALAQAFVDEASRFAMGAGAALYVRQREGHYSQQAGNLADGRADYPEDDRAFALMRAERRPVVLAQAHSALPGALALPMLDQGALAAFVLLDFKPDGSDYRPDEVEVLGWATEQTGFALKARYVHGLEEQVANLRAEVATLKATLSDLADRIGGPASQPTANVR